MENIINITLNRFLLTKYRIDSCIDKSNPKTIITTEPIVNGIIENNTRGIKSRVLGLDSLNDSLENTQIAASGKNAYVVVWDKKGPNNWEIYFTRSTNEGRTFEDAINLSNTPDTRSEKAIMLTDGENVYITWWETGKDNTSKPFMRVSNDGGATFRPVLNLSANGPIGGGG